MGPILDCPEKNISLSEKKKEAVYKKTCLMMTGIFFIIFCEKNILWSLASTTCEVVLVRFLNNDFYRDIKKESKVVTK